MGARSRAPTTEGMPSVPILEMRNVTRTFRQPGAAPFKAVDDASIHVEEGECLAIVGESGSGKSTMARMALGLLRPDGGDVILGGRSILTMPRREFQCTRLLMQPVFQDPGASFNPRKTVQASLFQAIAQCPTREPDPRERALEVLRQVELRPPEAYLARYPHQLSGGQRQRLAIARALAVRPRLIIADEPLSGADVSIRAQVLNLLVGLQREHGMSYLLITHDMLVAEAVSDRVAVMYRGRIVEEGPTKAVLAAPKNSYTVRLLSAVKSIDDADPAEAAAPV
jgi:peptide/nickel transport system ATP-binding protein